MPPRTLVGCELAYRYGTELFVKELARRVTAAAVAASLVVLVACDLSIDSFQEWWVRHSLTASIVSNLLVLAVTALIVDEVVARRQRKERSASVAVQALIVYGQGQRTWHAVKSGAAETKGEGDRASGALEEWRALAGMLLTASPALFDDPEARRFLEEIERFSGLILSKLRRSDGTLADDDRPHLEAEFSKVEHAIRPLIARVPTADQSLFEGPK
jgi:hypothetical protein